MSEKELYEVQVEFTMYVTATSNKEAEDVAQQHAGEEFNAISEGDGCGFGASKAGKWIEAGWRDGYPYGDNSGKTCAEWAEDAEPTPAQKRLMSAMARLRPKDRLL